MLKCVDDLSQWSKSKIDEQINDSLEDPQSFGYLLISQQLLTILLIVLPCCGFTLFIVVSKCCRNAKENFDYLMEDAAGYYGAIKHVF
jgi:hypothetical protein